MTIEKIDYNFISPSNLSADAERRVIGTQSENDEGYANYMTSNMLSVAPGAGTVFMFRDNASNIDIGGNITFSVNKLRIYSESQQAVLDTTSDTITFSGNNIHADIFVTTPANVIVTGSDCHIIINGGEHRYFKNYVDGTPDKSVSFTLNENIDQNYPVKIIDDSGAKIEKVLSDTPYSGARISQSFNSGNISLTSRCCFDTTNNKVIVAYRDNSSDGTVMVGSISGNAITFGSANVFLTGTIPTQGIDCCYDSSNNKVIIAYVDSTDSNHGYAVVGTVSGVTITLGTPVKFSASGTSDLACCFDSNSNKVVIAYENTGNTDGEIIVGTVSGTSITFGTKNTLSSSATTYLNCIFDSINNKVIIGGVISSTVNIFVGEVTGTTITLGAANTITGAGNIYRSLAHDTINDKIVMVYRPTAGGIPTGIVGEVSGKTITFGSGTAVDAIGTCYLNIVSYSPASGKIYTGWKTATTYETRYTIGTVSGNTITFEASRPISNYSQVAYTDSTYDSYNGKIIILNYGPNASQTFILDSTKFGQAEHINIAGILAETGTSGQSKSVYLVGDIIDTFTSQTPNTIAYVQHDGSISTSETPYPIGRFISATELLITKNP